MLKKELIEIEDDDFTIGNPPQSSSQSRQNNE